MTNLCRTTTMLQPMTVAKNSRALEHSVSMPQLFLVSYGKEHMWVFEVIVQT